MGTTRVAASGAMMAAHPRPLSWTLPLMGSIGSLRCGVPWVMSMGSVAETGVWAGVARAVVTGATAEADPEPRPRLASPTSSSTLPPEKGAAAGIKKGKDGKIKLCRKAMRKGNWQSKG
jgi:hypothetical protein